MASLTDLLTLTNSSNGEVQCVFPRYQPAKPALFPDAPPRLERGAHGDMGLLSKTACDSSPNHQTRCFLFPVFTDENQRRLGTSKVLIQLLLTESKDD